MSVIPRDPLEPIEDWHTYFLRLDWPNTERLRTAFAVARDVDTCADLLAGRPVDPGRLDRAQLEQARRRRLVRLDLTALDLLTASPDARAA